MLYDNKIHRTNGGPGIVAEGLGKQFGDLWALRDLDLHVPAGTVLGLLGHNGAGKTTAVRILTTLAQPTTGTARVAGVGGVAPPAAGPPGNGRSTPAAWGRPARPPS